MGREKVFWWVGRKLSSGKARSLVERDNAHRQKVIKLPDGKGGSFPVGREAASRWEVMKLPVGS